jgi:hypothetical protein
MALGTDSTTLLKPPKLAAAELLPTAPPVEEPATDFEKLRTEQHSQVDTNYSAATTNPQWEKVRLKYQGRLDLSADQYYEYAAAKQQYQLSQAGYDTQKQQAHTQIDAFYDLQKTLQAQGTELSTFTDEKGYINTMGLKDNPLVDNYRISLQSLRNMLSAQSGTTEEEKRALAEQLAGIDQELAGLDSIKDSIAKGEKYANQNAAVKFGKGAWNAMANIAKFWQDPGVKTIGLIPGALPIMGLMGGLSAAFPKNVAWFELNIDAPWGTVLRQLSTTVEITARQAYALVTKGHLEEIGPGYYDILGDYWWTEEARRKYLEDTPMAPRLIFSLTNPAYLAGGQAIGGGLKGVSALPSMVRAMPEAAQWSRAVGIFEETGLWAGRASRVTPEAAKAHLWVSRMPQEAALAKWMDLAAKYPWMSNRLPAIADALRPVTALQMFGNDLVPALLTPGEITARVALSTGNLAGAALKGTMKLQMAPVMKVAAPIRGLVVKEINIYQLNKALAKEELALVRNTDVGSIVIKGIGSKKGIPHVVARDIIEVDNYVQTMASPGGPTLIPATPRALNQRMYFDELARPGEAGEPAGAVFTNGEFMYGMRGSSITEGRMGTVYSLPPEATAPVEAVGAAVNPVIRNAENLTVVSEAQVRSGVKPANITPEIWERAKEAFSVADARLAGLEQAMGAGVESRMVPKDLEQQLWKPSDPLQPVALRIGRTSAGAKVLEAINGRSLAETQAQRAIMMKYAIQCRGASDVYMAMTRIMQHSVKDSGPFSCTKVVTEYGNKTNLLVKEGSIPIDQAIWDRLPENYKSWYQHDVLSWIPGSPNCPFKFNQRQTDYINALHYEIDQLYNLGVAEGIDVPRKWVAKTEGMAGSVHYIPRTMERMEETFSFKGLTEPRTYETAKDSIVIGKTGIASGIKGFQQYGETVWNRISNKHFMDTIETSGITEMQIVEKYAPELMPHIRALKAQMEHLPELERLLTEMQYRGKIPATATVKAALERYPEIAEKLGDVLQMPVDDVAALFNKIEQKTWDRINVEAQRLRAATEQAVGTGKAALDETAARGRIGSNELVEAIKDAQYERMFPGKGVRPRARILKTPDQIYDIYQDVISKRLVSREDLAELIRKNDYMSVEQRQAFIEGLFTPEQIKTGVGIARGRTPTFEEAGANAMMTAFDILKPEVTFADIRAAIKTLDLGKDAETTLLTNFYDRTSTFNIRYAKASQKALGIIKRSSESDYRAVLKTIKEQTLERKKALKGLEDVVAGERARIGAAQETAQKQFKMVAQAAKEQNQLYHLNVSIKELENRLFTKADAAYIERQYRSQTGQVNSWLQVAGKLSGFTRMAMAALDFSAPMTYGLPLMVTNPAGWGRAVAESFQTLWKPEVHMKYLAQHQDEVQEFVSKYGGYIGGSEFYEISGQFERAFKGSTFQGPVGVVETLVRTPYWHAEKAFGAFGDVARLELWGALRPMARTQAELYEVAQMVNKMVGVQDTRALGISASQRAAESAVFFFAPRYRRASWALMSDFFRGGISGTIARKAMIRMVAGGLALYVGLSAILKQEPQLNPLQANFMCLRIGDKYYGLSSAIISNVKFLTDLMVTSATKPSELFKWNRRTNPTLKYLYKGSAPMMGTVVEMITHKGFLGNPIETADEYAKYIVTKFTPFAFQELFTGGGDPFAAGKLMGTISGSAVGLMGMRAFEAPIWTKVRDMRNTLAAFAPDLTAAQKGLLDKGKLEWTDLNYAQQDAVNSENADLAALTLEAQAQSLERGGGYVKLRGEWAAGVKWINEEAAKAQALAKSERSANKTLHDIYLQDQAEGRPTRLSVEELYRAQNWGKIFRDKATRIGRDKAAQMLLLENDPRYRPVYEALAEWQTEKTADMERPTVNQAVDDYYTYMYSTETEYRQTVLSPTEDQYGNPIFAGIEGRERAWEAYYGHAIAEQARAYMHRNEDPLFAELRKAKKAMRPYWQLAEDLTASKQYPVDSNQQAQWVMEAMRGQNPTAARYYQQLQWLQANNPRQYSRLSSDMSIRALLGWANSLKVPTVTSILSAQRETFRRENPEIQAYGEMFYDWQPLTAQTIPEPVSTAQTGWR